MLRITMKMMMTIGTGSRYHLSIVITSDVTVPQRSWTMRHLVFEINFLKNFANLSIMSPCHCHLIFLSPVHHHHHHFHYASLHLCSTPDSKLTFTMNPSHHSLANLFRRISWIFMTIPGLNCSSLFCFVLFCFFIFFL